MSQGPQEQFPRQSWQRRLGRAITWWGTQTPFFNRTVLITAPWPTPSTFCTVPKETQIALACDAAPQSSYSHHFLSRYRVFNLVEQHVSFFHSPFLTRFFFLLLIKCWISSPFLGNQSLKRALRPLLSPYGQGSTVSPEFPYKVGERWTIVADSPGGWQFKE